MALQLRRKTHESIVYIVKDSAPRIMPSDKDFIINDLPDGTKQTALQHDWAILDLK